MVAPVEKGNKEATFIALAANFGFNDEVTNLFLKGPMESLEDFRYYFGDEKEIDAFVAAEGCRRVRRKDQSAGFVHFLGRPTAAQL